MRVKLDCVSDYLDLRKRVYGFELAPLPQSLMLPATESSLGLAARHVAASINSQLLSII